GRRTVHRPSARLRIGEVAIPCILRYQARIGDLAAAPGRRSESGRAEPERQLLHDLAAVGVAEPEPRPPADPDDFPVDARRTVRERGPEGHGAVEGALVAFHGRAVLVMADAPLARMPAARLPEHRQLDRFERPTVDRGDRVAAAQ